MAKKYSVNTENDEVVSVEVDGVEYASPDDIPDPIDRYKVNELIAKMTGGGAGSGGAGSGGADAESDEDAEFDARMEEEFKDFDKEFADFDKRSLENQREIAKSNRWLYLAFLVPAVLLLGVAIISGIISFRTVQKEQSAPGTVVDTVERESISTTSKMTIVYSYPVVEFTTPRGVQRVQLSEGSSPPAYYKGDSVTIRYDPDRLGSARIDSFSGTLMLWLVPGITGFLGAVFLVISLIVVKMHRSEVAQLEAEQAIQTMS